jgi:ACT domain-containing protein
MNCSKIPGEILIRRYLIYLFPFRPIEFRSQETESRRFKQNFEASIFIFVDFILTPEFSRTCMRGSWLQLHNFKAMNSYIFFAAGVTERITNIPAIEVIILKEKTQVVVTVMGSDRVGIVAGITKVLADCNANIIDISQTILQDIFAMILLVDIASSDKDLLGLEEALKTTGDTLGVKVVVQHQDIFSYMHRI